MPQPTYSEDNANRNKNKNFALCWFIQNTFGKYLNQLSFRKCNCFNKFVGTKYSFQDNGKQTAYY